MEKKSRENLRIYSSPKLSFCPQWVFVIQQKLKRIYHKTNTTIKQLENSCVWGTPNATAVATFTYSHKQKQKRHLITLEATRWYGSFWKLSKTFWILSIVSKFASLKCESQYNIIFHSTPPTIVFVAEVLEQPGSETRVLIVVTIRELQLLRHANVDKQSKLLADVWLYSA